MELQRESGLPRTHQKFRVFSIKNKDTKNGYSGQFYVMYILLH